MAVTISTLRGAIETAILGLEPDGRYSVESATLAARWRLGADPTEKQYQSHDLQAHVKIGGGELDGKTLLHPVAVMVTLAAYSGTRVMRGGLDQLTAEDRVDGACLHLIEALPKSCPGLLPVRYADPTILPGGEWIVSSVSFTLRRSR